VAATNPGTAASFNAVSSISSSQTWAAGCANTGAGGATEPLVEHWNGTAWSVSFGPTSGFDGGCLHGIYAASPTDVWAVGSDGSQALVEHYDGVSWSAVAIPGLGSATSSSLNAISGTGSHAIWIGGVVNGATASASLIEHYNGSWSAVSSPNPSGFGSSGISAIAARPVAAFAAGGRSYALRYGSGDFISDFAAFDAAGSPVQLGSPVSLSGELDFSESASAWGQTVHIERDNPDGSQTALPDQTTDDRGEFALTDSPAARGRYTYIASFDGSATRSGSSTQTTVVVHGTDTALGLDQTASRIGYKGSVTLTAHLTGIPPGATVTILKTNSAGATTVLGQGAVDSDGNFSADATLGKDATFQATFAGDGTYEPSKSPKADVGVRVDLSGTQSGFHATSGRYEVYGYSKRCAKHGRRCPRYTGHVRPSKSGRHMSFALQERIGHRWRRIGSADVRIGGRSRARVSFRYGSASSVVGHRFRERCKYATDHDNIGARTAWSYFTVTR